MKLRTTILLWRKQHSQSCCLHTSSRTLAPSPEAIRALEGFNSRFTSSKEPVTHYFQTIDANQIHLARLTLSSLIPLCDQEESILNQGKVIESGPPINSTLIPSEHLFFFTPRIKKINLGLDGSDASFNPPKPFTIRMWAGGEMKFEKDNSLIIGDEAWEKTIVEEAKIKVLKNGRGEMLLVWVKKEIGNKKGLCLTDRRSWIFQPALQHLSSSSSSSPSSSSTTTATPPSDTKEEKEILTPPSLILKSTKLNLDSATLFRYSALTFNAHAIHLSPPWAQQVEGHPNIVIHGPLNLNLLVRMWGRHIAGWTIDDQGCFIIEQGGKKIQRVEYRAKSPLHLGSPYWIGFPSDNPDPSASSESNLVAIKPDGQVAMEATITAW